MSLGANFTYTFVINYLLFSLLGHSFLFKARAESARLLITSLVYTLMVVIFSFLLVMLSWFLHDSLRVILFLIQSALVSLTFFFLFKNYTVLKRYDMPEDFVMYPYATVMVISSLYFFDAERTLALKDALLQAPISMMGMWMASYASFIYQEKFVLTPTSVGMQSKMRIFFSAVIFYIILSPLM